MIQERNVQHQMLLYCFKSFSPTSLNQVYYKYTRILSRSLNYISKLARMKNAVLNNIKLELPNNYFLMSLPSVLRKTINLKTLGAL